MEYAHAMNISHGELTWPLGLQQEVQEDHQAKMRAAQRGGGGLPRPQQIRAIMLGRLDKMNDITWPASLAKLDSLLYPAMHTWPRSLIM